MDEARRRELLDRLYNPQTPNPMISWDYGCLYRDLPPRRTLRERLRSLLRRAPRRPAA
jgi:hypothetical protein